MQNYTFIKNPRGKLHNALKLRKDMVFGFADVMFIHYCTFFLYGS